MNEEFSFELVKHSSAQETWCEDMKVIFMLCGTGWLTIEGMESEYVVSKKDIFVINSFQMHDLVLEEGAMAIMLLLTPSFLYTCSPEVVSPTFNCRSFLYREDRQQMFDSLRRDFALAFRAWYKNESEYSVHLRSRVMDLTDHLFRNFLQSDKGVVQESGRERIRAAVDYIHRHYRENITLSDLAAHAYLSVSYLSRSFQKYLGIPFTAYLTRVRVLQAAALLRGDKTITEIAYETGFSSASALIEAFKQYHGETPGQYRRSVHRDRQQDEQAEELTNQGFSTSFASLMEYADDQECRTEQKASVCEVSASFKNVRGKLKHDWKLLVNAGYARELLNGSMQDQIRELKETVGFRYIRCKGILDDDMMFYTRDVFGKVEISYVYMDRVLDFILSVHAKPMLEIGHMPSVLAQNPVPMFKRPVCISPPKDLGQWQRLIAGLMEHLLERYGEEELRQWLFEPWISVGFHIFGCFDLEMFEAVYSTSYREIKKACRDFLICGSGITLEYSDDVRAFLDLCRRQDCMPDIFTIRSFAAIDPKKEKNGLKLVDTNESFYLAVSEDESYLKHTGEEMRAFLKKEGLGEIPMMLEEWSNNIWQRDLCNDTSYKSAYIFKNVMENHDRFFGMGYFNVNDRLDEIIPAAETFHGGFGLFTENGLPKSACRAMQLLSRAGDRLLAEGDGYLITASEKEIQIFLHNYCHYDMLYRYRHTTNLTKTDRYRVFNEKPPVSFHIVLEGIGKGRHKVSRYGIGPEGGSIYDAWIEMGAPEPMSGEEKQALYRQSYPAYRTETIETEEILKIKAFLKPHEVQLITIAV